MYNEYEGVTSLTKVPETDQRVSLMERFVGLDQARIEAENGRDEATKRLHQIREEMASLRHELRKMIDGDADDIPTSAAR
jgi:hypothetical protein